jgi:DNA-binding transcriptional ArsR family regulator
MNAGITETEHAELYRALADPTRRVLLDELTDRNDQTLFELCSRLSMRHGISPTRQAVSQHLAVLEAAGLLTTRRAGRTKLHHFDPTPLSAIARRWPVPANPRRTPPPDPSPTPEP